MVESSEDKLLAAQRREYIFLAKTIQQEREMERLRSQLGDARVPAGESLAGTLADPTVNMEIKFLREKLLTDERRIAQLDEELQSRFDVKSSAGQKLVKKCRHLLEENQELGRQLAQDRTQDFQVLLDEEKAKTAKVKDRLRKQLEFNKVLDTENEKMQQTVTVLVKTLRETSGERDDLVAQLRELGQGPKRRSSAGQSPSAKRQRS